MIKSQDLRESGKKTKGGEVRKIKFRGSGGKQQLGLVGNVLLWHFIFSGLWLRKKRQARAEEFRAGNWQEHGNSWSTLHHPPPQHQQPTPPSQQLPVEIVLHCLQDRLLGAKRELSSFLPSTQNWFSCSFLCGLPPSWQHYLAAHELTHHVKLTENNEYPLTLLPTGEKLHFNGRPLELCVLIKRWTFPPLWCLREPFYFFSIRGMVVPIFSKLTIQIKVHLVSMRGQ